ncbi:MAG: insulinase family protein [Rhizobiales bacterium]|nr:insulinase family protein [Hyphomicrobiales bacterium]
MHQIIRCTTFFIALLLTAFAAHAMAVKEIKTPGGITAWVVEDHTIPLIAMEFSFAGGAALDPPGKEGATHFITGMMDEGAADLDGPTFQAKRDELAVKLSFDAGLDNFEGSLQTLSRNRDAAFELLRKALTAPRFEELAFRRVQNQFLVSAANNAQDPEKIASRRWMEQAFGQHPYARGSEGNEATIAKLVPDDLRAMHKRLFVKQGLTISVVGDIDSATLGALLDKTFGALPEKAEGGPVSEASVAMGPQLTHIARDIPQSIIVFGSAGIKRNDPEFIPAFVAMHILGGGGLGSRLTEEVREKRGLTYGVGIGLVPLDHAGLLMGSLGTRNEKAGEAMGVIREVLTRMAQEGPTQEELDTAKTFLTGSYALRFDSNAKIAGQLLGVQQDNLGIDYFTRRNGLIEAVTLDQVKAAAKRLLAADALIVSVVGKPEGLKSTGTGG